MDALTVVKTETMLVEYVKLPIESLALPFLYRMVEPVPTAWRHGQFSIIAIMETGGPLFGKFEEKLKELALDNWYDVLREADLPVYTVDVKECHIVRKPSDA